MRNGKQVRPGISLVGRKDYRVRVVMRDPATGKQLERERRLMDVTLTEAIQVQAKLRDELRAAIDSQRVSGHVGARGRSMETLTVYAQRWLKHLVVTGRNRKHVVERHGHSLERFVLPYLGHLVVGDVKRSHLVEWMGKLDGVRRDDGERYAKKSLESAWATLRTMLRDALVLCDLDGDVTHGVRFHAQGTEAKHKDVLTSDELGRLLQQTKHESDDMAVMIWLGFTTGMRFGETSALTWDDVDFDQRIVHVRKSQVGGVVGPTKTRTHRTVPILPIVVDMLKAHRRRQIEKQVRGLRTGLVFPSEAGTHRFSATLVKPLARCAANADVAKHVTAHTMRRTFNNLARQVAGDIVARSMTGHTTTEMTEHYSHVTREEKAKAVEAALGLAVLGTVQPAGVAAGDDAEIGPNPSVAASGVE